MAESVCGKYRVYPDLTGARCAEGGMRLRNIVKHAHPGKPLVSVVTTVLNSGCFIEKAMCSVFSQDYENVEYIVIDGGSTDGTLAMILKYEDCIDYFISEPDHGLYEGINKGIALASGDYILVLNSDDWYAENCISTLVKAKMVENSELVSALGIETDRWGKSIRQIPSQPFKANVRIRMPLRHETMLVSKKLYNQLGAYDESYRIIADLKFTAKLYEHVTKFVEVKEPLLFFRKIGIASSLNATFFAERQRLLKEHFPFLDVKELELLSKEYSGEIGAYASVLDKHKGQKRFEESVLAFLGLHNAHGSLGDFRRRNAASRGF